MKCHHLRNQEPFLLLIEGFEFERTDVPSCISQMVVYSDVLANTYHTIVFVAAITCTLCFLSKPISAMPRLCSVSTYQALIVIVVKLHDNSVFGVK
jgi:SNF family Na+-dependent transporter